LLIRDIEPSRKHGSLASGRSVLSGRKIQAKMETEPAVQAGIARPRSPVPSPADLARGELIDKLSTFLGNSEMSRTDLNHAFRPRERRLLKPILTKLLEEGRLGVRFGRGKTGRARAMFFLPGAISSADNTLQDPGDNGNWQIMCAFVNDAIDEIRLTYFCIDTSCQPQT
jgi:hypothetical protein